MKLGDICDIQSGGTPSRSKNEYWFNGTIPWVKISDINSKFVNNTEEYITDIGLRNSSAKIFPKGTIIYTIFATIGEVAILNCDACTNQAIAGLKIIDKNISKEYLYHYLVHKKEKVKASSRGVAQNNINLTMLRALEIDIPKVSEQQKKANALNKICALIDSRKIQLSRLDQLAKSRFIEMFGDDCSKVNPLEKFCDFIRNGVNIKQSKDSGGYPITRIETISNDVFNFDRLGYAGIFTLDKYADYVLHKGDILISHINSEKYLGRVVQYKGTQKIIHGMNLLCLRPKGSEIATFLEYYLKSRIAKEYVSKITKKAVNQASFSVSDYKNLPVKIVSKEKCTAFNSFIEQLDKSKFRAKKCLKLFSYMRHLRIIGI